MPKGRKARRMRNFIVTFSDLTDKKQDEIIRAMVRSLLDEGFDGDEADAIEEATKRVIKACSATSYEWEVIVQ
jgi:hypothetical protein